MWSWSYGSWISYYLCNQCLSLLKLWVRIPLRQGVFDATLCHKVCQYFVSGFLWVLQFPPPIKLTTMIYNWNIVECGVKHHNTKPPPISPKHHYNPFWYIYPNYDLKLYQYIYFELHVYYLFCWICIIDLRQDDLLYKHLNCMMTSLMFVLYGVHSEVVSITWCNPCLFIHIAFKN